MVVLVLRRLVVVGDVTLSVDASNGATDVVLVLRLGVVFSVVGHAVVGLC